MVRHYQPDVIIDNRLEGAGDNHGSIATEHPLIYSGTSQSPEQIIPQKEFVMLMVNLFHRIMCNNEQSLGILQF